MSRRKGRRRSPSVVYKASDELATIYEATDDLVTRYEVSDELVVEGRAANDTSAMPPDLPAD